MRNTQLSLIGLMVLLGGCASHSSPCREPGTAQVQHVIVCWLKQPGNEKDRRQLIETSRGFQGKIPGLVCVQAGTAQPSTRMGVDSSFDVAVVMTFVDESALKQYETHRVHQDAVQNVLKPLVKRFVIYDFGDR